ncbi:peroxidase, partial [Methylobacterium radiotolerans]
MASIRPGSTPRRRRTARSSRGADLALTRADTEAPAAPAPLNGSLTVPFHGVHQAGIDTAAQAHGSFVA